MKLNIDSAIFKQHPDLKIGALLIRRINNAKRVSAVESLLRGICAQRSREFKDKDIYEHSMIIPWSSAYGKFGVNPKKYPPSIVALLKRVQTGKDLPHINVIVDIYNYFSLKYLLPIGGEDVDWLCGDLNLTFTGGGESFRPLGTIDVEKAKEGEVAYKDSGGITCRYWNYRECERTKFTEKTVNALILVEDLSKMHMDQFGTILQDMQNSVAKYIGGTVKTYILNEESGSIDLEVEGRKNVDDSKIPQQERAFYNAKIQKPQNEGSKEKPPKKKFQNDLHKSAFLTCCNEQLKQKITKLFEDAVKEAFPEIYKTASVKEKIQVEYPGEENHGDYASSIALRLVKELGKNPREIAEKIIEKIGKNEMIEKIEIAGPGFINVFISEKILKKEITKILKEKEKYGETGVGKNKNLIVEYSQPNIAKPLGVHHLLSTIIGQSLYNIFSKLGFNTISINHIGDWGTQFGKLIYAYKKWGDKKIIEENPIPELQKLYVKFHNEAEKDLSIEDGARKEFKKFEEGDKGNRELWKWFVEESMQDVQKTYDNLGGIHFDYTHGESFYEDKMGPILEKGKKKGIFEKGEEGAYVIHFEDKNLPTVPVQKKDGTTLYITRDLAQIKYRIETWKPVKILYVVDIAQTLHFKQYFEAARMLGFQKNEGVHVWFGRMHLKDKKMSTRKGNIILLDEVLDEAVKRAGKIIEEKSPDLKNKDKVARIVGIGAIKYNILSQNRTTDITFDWDKMLSLEGNSGPYLQYTYARAKSILRKAQAKNNKAEENTDTEQQETAKSLQLQNKTIHSLIRLFPRFPEYLTMAAEEYKPNILSNYIYELAQKFNAFYNNVPVLRAGEQDKKERLEIVEGAAQILKNGLSLLGVEVVEEM